MKNKKILFIDDDEDLLKIISLKLRDHFSVVVASSADEAIEKFKLDKFSCIVSDISMPGITGIDIIVSFKLVNPDYPVIIYTGMGNKGCKEEMLCLGADAFIIKSKLNIKVLKESIINAIEKNVPMPTEDEIDKIVKSIISR